MFKRPSDKPKVDVLENKIPTVMISKNALKKMNIYIDECSEEIGWLGTAYKVNGVYFIDDVLLFEQEVHSTTTEITPEGLSEFGEEILVSEGGVDLWNSIKVWGHSHVNMSTFSSGQDDSQMKVFSDCGHDFFIRIIGNKKGELKVDLYNFETGVIYNNVPWVEEMTREELEIISNIKALEEEVEKLQDQLNLMSVISDEDKKIVKEEMDKKVRKKTTFTKVKGDYVSQSYKEYRDNLVNKGKKKGTEDEGVVAIGNEYGVEEFILQELANVYTIYEAKEILELYGYKDEFSDAQIRDMMYEAQELYYFGDYSLYGYSLE